MTLVLDPLKIAHGHAAGIGQHIRDDKDAFFCQDVVCCWGGGAVCALDEDFGLDAGALFLLIWSSSAAGIKISLAIPQKSSAGICLSSWQPAKPRCGFSAQCARKAGTSRPSSS